MQVPVYLFMGFMDSGKTTLVTETLLENDFLEPGDRGLIIACEDGDEEYDEEKLLSRNLCVMEIEDEKNFNPDYLAAINMEYEPDMVFVEYNGTWPAAKILEMKLPSGWEVVQILSTVDASTFELYLTNMRQMMMEQVKYADVVIFNRCTDDTDKSRFRRIVKAVNRKAQIAYERADGTMDDAGADELPYDINQDYLDITDADFGIFYLDVQDDPKKYEGKKIHFLGYVYRPKKMGNKPMFVPGRFAMTCCVQDIQFIGFKCKYDKASSIPHESWVDVTAEVRYEFAKEYRGKGPVLYATEVTPAKAPADQLVYFT